MVIDGASPRCLKRDGPGFEGWPLCPFSKQCGLAYTLPMMNPVAMMNPPRSVADLLCRYALFLLAAPRKLTHWLNAIPKYKAVEGQLRFTEARLCPAPATFALSKPRNRNQNLRQVEVAQRPD